MQETGIEQIISLLTKELEPVQEKINSQFTRPQFPVALILGSPRSGTTLILQYLAASNLFSYPSNLMTRFAYAPYLGAQIQELIFNKDYGLITEDKRCFSSDLGKTQGALDANEFYHFWRRFIPYFFPEFISKQNFNKINFEQIFQELASIESIYNKPFVCKGLMLQYNLQELDQKAEQFLFLRVKRKPEFIMQSIFSARKKYYGTINEWWSVKPKQYKKLLELDVYHQIAGQVYYTEKSIDEGLKSIDDDKQITISYEKFCRNPINILYEINEKYKRTDILLSKKLPKYFDITDIVTIEIKDMEKLQNAYEHFCNLKIVLD